MFPIAVYESSCSSTSQFYSLRMLCACYVYAKSLQLCSTLCDPMDCSPPGSSVHGILQARILEWVAMPSSRGSSRPRDRTCISCGSCTAGGFFTAEPMGKPWCTYLHVANLCEPVKLLSRVWLFAIPWTVAYQAPPSMEFSRQEYWSRLPFPFPGDLPDPGIKPRSYI